MEEGKVCKLGLKDGLLQIRSVHGMYSKKNLQGSFEVCHDSEYWVDRVTRSDWYVIVERRVIIVSAEAAH